MFPGNRCKTPRWSTTCTPSVGESGNYFRRSRKVVDKVVSSFLTSRHRTGWRSRAIVSSRAGSSKGHVLLATRLGLLDALAVIEGGKSYDDLLEHTVEIDFRGHTLRVLELRFLIELKKTSKDLKDKQRLPLLEETLRQLREGYGREGDEEDRNDK